MTVTVPTGRDQRIGLAADARVHLQAYADRPMRNGPGPTTRASEADDAVVIPTTRTTRSKP